MRPYEHLAACVSSVSGWQHGRTPAPSGCRLGGGDKVSESAPARLEVQAWQCYRGSVPVQVAVRSEQPCDRTGSHRRRRGDRPVHQESHLFVTHPASWLATPLIELIAWASPNGSHSFSRVSGALLSNRSITQLTVHRYTFDGIDFLYLHFRLCRLFCSCRCSPSMLLIG